MIGQLLLASFGWSLVITFGLAAIVVFISGWNDTGSSSLGHALVFLLCLVPVLAGVLILFGGNYNAPIPFATSWLAMLTGSMPLFIFAIGSMIFLRSKEDE